MKCLEIIVLLTVAFGAANAAKKVVCYYSSWAIYYKGKAAVAASDLDATLCTHINYAFVQINADGTLKIEDNEADITQGGIRKTSDLKKQNPAVKLLFSIGSPAQTFASVAASAAKRANFVKSARSYVQQYNFDGIDLDWEIPQAADKANFIALLQDLKTDFSKNGWLLSSAVSADMSPGYDVPKMTNLLDMINIMDYDLYGPWSSYTGQNSALYPSPIESDFEKNNLNMDSSIKQWLKAGASPDKLIAGIPFYGHSFTLSDKSKKGLHAPIKGTGKGGSIVGEAGSISYIEYCTTQASWQCTWDDVQKMPICVNGDQWLGFDNVQSIGEKMKYISAHNLGGAMIWSIDQDDVHGLCGKKNPLLTAINAGL